MSIFEPELGQMAFGQPHQTYAIPEIMLAALLSISLEIERVWWNVWQADFNTPFENNGPRCNFKCAEFEVRAYSWSDEEQPYNFAWRDIRISWYKWCGRGASSNIVITPDLASECLDACLLAVRQLDGFEAAFKECCVGVTR